MRVQIAEFVDRETIQALATIWCTDLLKEVARRLILAGRFESRDDGRKPAPRCLFRQHGHHAMFDAAAKHAAAQQKCVDDKGAILYRKYHHSGKAVIAETIRHLDRSALHITASGKALDFLFGAADRSEVELVGALRQLRGP